DAHAWLPTVSLPQPMAPFDRIYSMQSTVGPGECGPLSSALRKSFSLPLRVYQSVRINTQVPLAMSPCFFSQARTPSAESRKSGFFFTSALQSMTLTGATKFLGGILSVEPSG